MSIEVNDNLLNKSNKDFNDKTGIYESGVWRPYNNITEALENPKLNYRNRGLIIFINKSGILTEYWFRDGINDEDLIEKINIVETPDATSSVKGKLKLTNHLGGTSDLPTVVAVETKSISDNSTAPASTAYVKELLANTGTYTLPKATSSILGGIKTGAGIKTDSFGTASLEVKTINGNSIIGTGNIDIAGGGGGGGSQTLQQTLNLGRVGDKMQITESLQIPTTTPSTINAGDIWLGPGTSGGGGGGGGGGGTVTNVAMTSTDFNIIGSPINTSGTIVANIKNSAVTFAKIQNVSTGVLIGRGGVGTGVLGEVTIGSGLALNSSNVLSATGGGGGGSGSVTNVSSANSDITVTNPTTTPVLTLNSALYGASTIVKRDGGGGIGFNVYNDRIVSTGQGILNYEAGTSGYGEHNFKVNSGQNGFKVSTDRTLTAPRYASGGTAPTTTGATKMMVVDTNGLFSFKNEPALSQTLQQTLDLGRIGDSMKITTSMEIPTSAPSTINTGNVWVGTGTSIGSLTKTKVNSLSDLTSTSLSIGSAQASTYLVATNSSAISATISTGLALTSVFVRQGGTGKVSFTGSGVTVLVKPTKVARTEGQNAVVEIFYETTTRVVITGDLDI